MLKNNLIILAHLIFFGCQKKIYCFNQRDCFNKTQIIFSAKTSLNEITFKFENKSNRIKYFNDTIKLYYYEDNKFNIDSNEIKNSIGYTKQKLFYEHVFNHLIAVNPDSDFTFKIDKDNLTELKKVMSNQSFQIFYQNDTKKIKQFNLFYGMLASNYITISNLLVVIQ